MEEFGKLPKEIRLMIWKYAFAHTLRVDIRKPYDDRNEIIITVTVNKICAPCKEAWEVDKNHVYRQERFRYCPVKAWYQGDCIMAAPFAMDPKFDTLYFVQATDYIRCFAMAFPTVQATSVAVRLEPTHMIHGRLDLEPLCNDFSCLKEIILVSPAKHRKHELFKAREKCKMDISQNEQDCKSVMQWPHAAAIAVILHAPIWFGCESDKGIVQDDEDANVGTPYSYIWGKPGSSIQHAQMPQGYAELLHHALRYPSRCVAVLKELNLSAESLV